MAKPAQDAKWATSGSALIQDPGVGKRDTGWVVEIPPVEFMNWWMNNVGNWIEYLDEQVDAVLSIQGVYDAVIGNGAYADINEVIADMGVNLPATNVKVFLKDPITVTDTQLIDKEGFDLDIHPSASIAKGASLVIGVQIDAARAKIRNGRFLNFNEGGGKAIDLTSNATLCFVQNNAFNNNTADIVEDPAATKNIINNNVVE